MSKDQWIEEHDSIGEDFASCKINREEALNRLQSLGFEKQDACDQMDALEEEIKTTH